MKGIQIIVAIVACVVFCGCFTPVKYEIDFNKDKKRALLSCYQLSGASETKYKYAIEYYKKRGGDYNWITAIDKTNFDNWATWNIMKKIEEIAKAKASKNGSLEQMNQCLKSIETSIEKNCRNDAFCMGKVGEEYIAHTESMKPKLKNIKFTCSQEDEVFKNFAPKFDKDIEQYALDLIKWKPIVSKDIFDDTLRDIITKDLKQSKIDNDIIKNTLNDLADKSICIYKMQYYVGDLEKLEGFKKSGIFADSIAKGYNDFIEKKVKDALELKEDDEVPSAIIIIPYTSSSNFGNYFGVNVLSIQSINKDLANIDSNINLAIRNKHYARLAQLITQKRYTEAMLKFLKED